MGRPQKLEGLMKRIDDCNTCGIDRCNIMRSAAPKLRTKPSPRQQRVIEHGCRAWTARPDIGKGLGYLSDARHSLPYKTLGG